MKTDRKWTYAALPAFVLISLLAISCGGSGDDAGAPPDTGIYTNSNLPSRYSVAIPTSIKESESKTLGYNRYGRAVKVPSFDRAGESQAYRFLQDEVFMVRDFFSDFEIEFMMIDAAYSQVMAYLNNASGKVPEGTLNITFTQAMANKITALYPDDADFLPTVGATMPVPELDVSIDAGAADYNFTIQYADDFNEEGLSMSSTSTIKWNTSKTKVFIARSSTITEGGLPMTFSYKLSYDDATKTMTLQMASDMPDQNTSFTSSVIMRETGGPNNEINLTDTTHINFDGTPTTYTMIGKADNNGGVVQIEFDENLKFRETFDGNGIMTGQASWNVDSSSWIGDSIDDCSGYEVVVTGFSINSLGNIEIIGGTGVYVIVIVPDTFNLDTYFDNDDFLASITGYGLYASGDGFLETGYWGTAPAGLLSDVNLYVERFEDTTFTYHKTTTTVNIIPEL